MMAIGSYMIKEFKTQKNKTVEIVEPSLDRLSEILEFVNNLAKEDTFLSFHPGKEISREEEEAWLKSNLQSIENKTLFIYWAIYNGRIVGAVDIRRGNSVREWHIGTIGLMVAQDFRGEGLGKFLLESILIKAKEMGIRTAVLGLFSDNEIAKNLYEKLGFVEYGVLPDGVYRQNKFSDHLLMYKRVN